MSRALLGTIGGSDQPGGGVQLLDLAPRARIVRDIGGPVGQSPSFLAAGPGNLVYAAHELDQGAVSAWTVHRGYLRQIGPYRPVGGAGPCHLSVDPSGRFVLVACYRSGTVALLPIQADGSLGDPIDVALREGNGPNPERQASPHPHMVVTDPQGGRVLVADLGTDSIARYRLDASRGALRLEDEIQLHPGAGPRHLVRSGRYLLVADELDSTVTVLEADPRLGTMRPRPVDTVSTVPSGVEQSSSQPSAIVLSPDGRHCYVANRGPDTIAVFSVEGPALRLLCCPPCGGADPRDLALDGEGGELIFVANQGSGTVTSLRVDPKTGLLSSAMDRVVSAGASCLLPLRPETWPLDSR